MDLMVCSQHCCFNEGEPKCTNDGHEPRPENNHVEHKLCRSFCCVLVQCTIFLINKGNYSPLFYRLPWLTSSGFYI